MNPQNEHPEIAEVNWIDDQFRVEQTRWKTWKSFSKDNKELIYALTEESCISGTRFYLKGCQEGWDQPQITYESTVGGKL